MTRVLSSMTGGALSGNVARRTGFLPRRRRRGSTPVSAIQDPGASVSASIAARQSRAASVPPMTTSSDSALGP